MPDQPDPPGPARPRRYVPRLHWELIACGTRGHLLAGTDAAELRPEDAILARPGNDGTRWYRCLRCDAWISLPRAGDAGAAVPARPRRARAAAPRAPAARQDRAAADRGRPRAALRHPHHAGDPDLRLPRERGRAARAGLPRDRRPPERARRAGGGRARDPRRGPAAVLDQPRDARAGRRPRGAVRDRRGRRSGRAVAGEALGGVPDVHRHDGAAPAGALRDHPPLHPAQGPHADHQPRGLRVPHLREAAVRRARRRRRRGGAARARRGLARRRAGHRRPEPQPSRAAGAARTAGSRRAGSTRPPWACRSARAR